MLRSVLDTAKSGDHLRAGALAEQALASGLEHPLLFNVAALKAEREGRIPQAERLLQRAVEIAPADVGARNALALLCLTKLEQPREALRHIDAVLALDSSLPYAHTTRGNALLAVGAVKEAEASFHRALELQAAQPVALAGLAHIASRRGAFGEARKRAAAALEMMPGFPDAVMSLAVAELGERRPNRAETHIRALLADQRLSPLERTYAQGLLGDILDAQQKPGEAWEAYSACNTALRSMHAARFAGRESALEYVRALTGYFERAPLGPWKSQPPAPAEPRRLTGVSAAREHLFVLGFPRSGTTLLEVVLEGHPEVVSLEENELLMHGVGEFMRSPEDVERLVHADAGLLAALRAAYWQLVAQAGVDVSGKVFVDKYPLNTLKLPLIARLFPHAKILFACRDPRDVVLSCFRRRFAMSAPIYELLTLEGAARFYDAVMQFLIRMTTTLPLEVCLVRHEDVVTEFRREMKRICEFLDLEWHSAMGDFALRTEERAVLTPSTAQLMHGLNTEGLGQWRRYREQLEPILPLLDAWVKRFGYDP
ncbi:MAG TPA: sulfotransferase [Steroidobacteraceae bacterium]|nr:sulfotransferase [Steroidobacteraceae bacterium]